MAGPPGRQDRELMTVTHHSDNSSGFANGNSNSNSNSNNDRITGTNRIQQLHTNPFSSPASSAIRQSCLQ
jgi:hypothetical protein